MSARSHRVAALAVAISLLAPAGALAQDEDTGLSEDPPVQLGGGSDSGSEETPAGTGGSLADTGAEPALLGFAGLGLLLLGAGLRLRLPADGRR